MINFLGCSFTWGQGLYFEEWHKNGISPDVMNKYINKSSWNHESLSYNDHLYRKEKHFPNLVSKHFDRDYSTQFFNGGSNYGILKYCDIIGGNFPTTDILVIQITSPTRKYGQDNKYLEFQGDPEGLHALNEANYEFEARSVYEKMTDSWHNSGLWSEGGDNIIPKNICRDLFTQIYLCDYKIGSYPNNRVNWIGLSWFPEAGFIIKEFFPENYIPIYYKNVEYLGFEHILSLDKLNLKNTIPGCGDEHFSSEGHIILSNSIIKKIEQDNLFKDINIK